jgi:hypothetical protein
MFWYYESNLSLLLWYEDTQNQYGRITDRF